MARGAMLLSPRVRYPRIGRILLDLMMPGLDGLEVCRQCKADPATPPVPIIFPTASKEMSHLVQGLAAGAVDVTKPFNPPELPARVGNNPRGWDCRL